MNILKNGDIRVSKILNKSRICEDSTFRLSKFTYLYSEDNRYVIKNMLSLEVMELTNSEWSAIQKIISKPVNYGFIAKNKLEQLVMSRYIVEIDYNELKQYDQILFLIKTMNGEKKGLSTYTIFPTTGCNARCIYCYEKGYTIKTMTMETANRLVEFISETWNGDMVQLSWFGGEPLLGANIIQYICKALKDREIPYQSSMITNASLITKELAHEAKNLWHLNEVQVSLDGVKEDYALRKNYYNPKKYNYDVVMDAIHFLSNEGIRVNLRVNVDFENIKRIEIFLHDIKDEFKQNQNVTLYIAPLYQTHQSEHYLSLCKEVLRLSELQNELGIPKKKPHNKQVQIRINNCMADNIKKSIVITPDGKFNNCEHLPERNSWGNIFDGVTDKEKFDCFSSTPKIDKQCAECPFLPKCTPFYKTGCPEWTDTCYEASCLQTEYTLHKLLKGNSIEIEV